MATKRTPKEQKEYSQVDMGAIIPEPTDEEIKEAVSKVEASLTNEQIELIKEKIKEELQSSEFEAVRTPGEVSSVVRESKRAGDVGMVERTRKARLKEYYENEEKVPVSASPVYAPYVGRIQQIIINDAWVTLPCNGETYPLPKTFADAWIEKKYAMDRLIAKQQRMADYDGNYESIPGSINL